VKPPNVFRTFLFSYQHNDKTWGFDVQATSAEDAQARLAKMARGTYEGTLIAAVPVHRGPVGLWRRLFGKGFDVFPRPELVRDLRGHRQGDPQRLRYAGGFVVKIADRSHSMFAIATRVRPGQAMAQRARTTGPHGTAQLPR